MRPASELPKTLPWTAICCGGHVLKSIKPTTTPRKMSFGIHVKVFSCLALAISTSLAANISLLSPALTWCLGGPVTMKHGGGLSHQCMLDVDSCTCTYISTTPSISRYICVKVYICIYTCIQIYHPCRNFILA